MLTILQLVERVHARTGKLIHPATVHNWLTNGLGGIILPHHRIGPKAKIRVQWKDYCLFRRRYIKAKAKAKRRSGKRSVVTV